MNNCLTLCIGRVRPVLIFSFLLFWCFFESEAQTNLWAPSPTARSIESTDLLPDLPDFDKGAEVQLDLDAFISQTKQANHEGTPNGSATSVWLPLPGGGFERFRLLESSLMSSGLAADFPEIKSYLLKGIDDPYSTGRMTVSPYGFDAYFASLPTGREVLVRKISKTDPTQYLSFWAKDDPLNDLPYSCSWSGEEVTGDEKNESGLQRMGTNETGDELRLFRLAITVPGDLSEQRGWTTKAQALAATVAFLGEINVVYERDFAVRFVLPENQDAIIYVNAEDDPFVVQGGSEVLSNNQVVTDQLIGTENYDVGMILVVSGCCAAYLSSLCNDNSKAGNFSRYNNLQVTCHEIGHQFGCHHAWAYCGGAANGGSHASEIGSGSTVMAYPGICGADNVTPTGATTFFGVRSHVVITDFIESKTCYQTYNTGNHTPVVTVPSGGFHIPKSTPFALTGSATDMDGDDLTYSWEQYNLYTVDYNTAEPLATAPTADNVPIFRVFNPVTSPTRTFPQLPDLVANVSNNNEKLPTYTRNLKFRLFVRDNHPGTGGTASAEISFEVDGTAGPFLVTAPNTAVTWAAGSNQTVTWDVASTDNANVNCQNVKISLSLDGGFTYPHVLVASTANDGSESVTLPSGICSSEARIKVEAVGNIFFDISDANFNIDDGGGASIEKPLALTFDGVNDQVTINNTLGDFGMGDFTIETWVKTTDTDGGTLLGKGTYASAAGSWNLLMAADGKPSLIMLNNNNAQFSSANATEAVNDGNWHHIAVARSNGGFTLRIYIDGVDKTSGGSFAFGNNSINPGDLIFGNNVFAGFNFEGLLDDIRFWSVARTETEINDGKNCALAGTEANLLAYYKADVTQTGACPIVITTLTDESTNSNNGTYQNGASAILSSADVKSECPTCTAGNVTITGQPASQTLAVGAPANFTVTATGNNLCYQWEWSDDMGMTYTPAGGETGSSYGFTAAATHHDRRIRCVINNGCEVETSSVATLTVNCPAPSLSSMTGNAAPCQNNYYTYYVSPNTDIVTWNWSAPAGWQVTNQGNMAFVSAGSGSGNISVTGTDGCGNMTAAQTLAVAPVLVQINSQPSSQTVSEGGNASFSVGLSGPAITTTYQWDESTDGGQTFSAISGATAATYSLTSVPLGLDDRQFRCRVTNDCYADTSDVATLTVNCATSAPTVPDAIVGAGIACASSTMTYMVPPVPGATTYTWTLPAGWSGSSTTNSISVTSGTSGGVLKVKANNGCGSSADRSRELVINNATCGRSVHFDGENDHLRVAQNSQNLNGDLTVSLWFFPEKLTGTQGLILNGREFMIKLLGDDEIFYQHSIAGGGYNPDFEKHFDVSLQTNTWQHLAITRDATAKEVTCYLNGTLIETVTYDAAVPTDNTEYPIYIGSGMLGDFEHFQGRLDEIKIWDAERSVTDIQNDMFCIPSGTETNLKAYFGFETGNINGNNGGISSFPNAVSGTYPAATIHDLAMNGPTSNVTDGSKGDGGISGPDFACPNTSGLTYSVDFPGSPTVTWTLPSGWSGTSTSESITVSAGANGGVIRAAATLSCGMVSMEKAVGTTPGLVNSTLWGGVGLDFDGTDDYLEIPSGSVNLANRSFTVEFWAKRATSGTSDIVVEQGSSGTNTRLHIGFRNSDLFTFAFWGNDLNTTATYTDSDWHHWACVYDKSIASPGHNRFIYRDGVLVASDRSDNDLASSGAMDIGRYSSDYFGGSVDELKIWDEAKSLTEIKANQYCPLECPPATLRLYLPFEDGTANGNNSGVSQTRDYSIYGNNAALIGFAKTGTASNFVSGASVKMTGGESVCPTLNWKYEVPEIAGATSYTWTLPGGWSGTSTTQSISVSPSATNGSVQCVVAAPCGNLTFSKTITIRAECKNGIDLDGSNDRLSLGNGIDISNSSFTVEFWAKRATSSTAGYVVGQRNGVSATNEVLHIGYRSNGNFTFAFYGNDLDASSSYVDTEWHHWACVYDKSIASPDDNRFIYRDGILVASDRSSSDFLATGEVTIGGVSGWSTRLEGKVDEVKIWNAARTAAQIAEGIYCPLTTYPASLLAYLPFEEGLPGGDNTGLSAALDFSTHGNHATFTGPFALTGAASNYLEMTKWTRQWYADTDSDGFGNAAAAFDHPCGGGTYVDVAGDCDDTDNAVHPDADEKCGNGSDDNCNGITDENRLTLDFESGDRINFGNSLGNFGAGDFTVEMRIKTTDTFGGLLSNRGICSHGNWWNFLVYDGKINFEIDENSAGLNYLDMVSAASVNDGAWHHVAAVRSGTTIILYLDGVEVKRGTSAANISNSVDLEAGKSICSSNFDYDGEMDEIRIWSLARSATEINLFKNARVATNSIGLMAYFNFDNEKVIASANNAGQVTLEDVTANTNDGTLNNFALNSTAGNYLGNNCLCSKANGNWNSAATWTLGAVPPDPLPSYVEMAVKHAVGISAVDPTLTGNLHILGAGTLTIDANRTLTSGGILDNSGTLTNNGTLVQNGMFKNTGTFNHNGMMKGGGTVDFAFTNPSGSTIAPGTSPGCLTYNNDFTNNGKLEIELADGTACTNFDQIMVNGDAAVNGNIEVSFIGGNTPTTTTFTILTANNISGTPSITWPSGFTGTQSIINSTTPHQMQLAFSALPVELVNFRAILLENNSVQLLWKTESEINNKGFEIERSRDGIFWENIGFVNGHGTTVIPHEYLFVNKNPYRGINYFRLRQMDYDGQFEYSNTVSVELEYDSKLNGLSIYPNPVKAGWLNVEFPEDNIDVKMSLFSISGHLLLEGQMDNQNNQVNMTGLPPGIYVLKIKSGNELWQERVLKY